MTRLKMLAILIGMTASYSVAAAKLDLDLSQTTVSGFSSGGYMALQFHQAHADWVKGVGVIAAGPYYCAKNNLMTALANCVDKGDPATDLSAFSQYQQAQQQQKTLASAEQLKKTKVWIFRGKLDDKVVKPVTDALAQQYAQWLPELQINYVSDLPVAHLFPTKASGGDCQKSEAPFIGNCNYDAAGEMLSFFYTNLNKPAESATQPLKKIKQPVNQYPKASLTDKAYVYIPESCVQGQKCRLHVSFHGCNQYSGAAGVTDEYAKLTGFNAWADSNNLVVLYPQTKSSMMSPFNPQGCWDWWGYTGEDYATRDGQQIQAVTEMINNLQGKSL